MDINVIVFTEKLMALMQTSVAGSLDVFNIEIFLAITMALLYVGVWLK